MNHSSDPDADPDHNPDPETGFVYGPIPSRRLGRSLGVNLLPLKSCNYNCIYCQLGRTTQMLRPGERREFYPRERVRAELERALAKLDGALDAITFVGEGEPTLYDGLGWLIRAAKRLAPAVQVALITNGSLLSDAAVRAEVAAADTVMPSLDAGTAATFRRINRPQRAIAFEAMVDGLVRFRDEFDGLLWVEVMLVKGVNDSDTELDAIRAILERVRPDRVAINIPIRPPVEEWVEPPDAERLARATVILGATALAAREKGDIVADTERFPTPEDAIRTIARRHPIRWSQAIALFQRYGVAVAEAETRLERLITEPHVHAVAYHDDRFLCIIPKR